MDELEQKLNEYQAEMERMKRENPEKYEEFLAKLEPVLREIEAVLSAPPETPAP